MERCRQCGTGLRARWLNKTDGERLCKRCFGHTVICNDCGRELMRSRTVTIKRRTLCRECMLRDEEPIEVTLVRSSWAPWGEEPTHAKNELLPRSLFPGKRVHQEPPAGREP